MVERQASIEHILRLQALFPVVTILGARQVGKSTLARLLASTVPYTWFDAETHAMLPDLRIRCWRWKGSVAWW